MISRMLASFIQDSPKCLLRVAASERQSSRFRSSDGCSLWFTVEVDLIIVILLVFIFLVLFTVSQAQVRCRCRIQWRLEVAQALSTVTSASADCVSEDGNSGRIVCSTARKMHRAISLSQFARLGSMFYHDDVYPGHKKYTCTIRSSSPHYFLRSTTHAGQESLGRWQTPLKLHKYLFGSSV